MDALLENTRVAIPKTEVYAEGLASDFFEILDNSQNITEEFLYAHQPLQKNTVAVYSTSQTPIGALDEDVAKLFSIISGPAIIVARKGYAGRIFVVKDNTFIVHEDGYPIRAKEEYRDKINLDWFVGHYSAEFQGNRTSEHGIGDFPRTRFNNIRVVIPKRAFQDKVAHLYERKDKVLNKLNTYKHTMTQNINKLISAAI